jgi:hypothetical protein
MNLDPSNNIGHRRNHGLGVGSGNGSRNSNLARNINDDRFNQNQYYNAVEDEQIYMDEYTTLIHQYNDFIMNGNIMFTRMEQTLRENLARSIVRQTFYYEELRERIRNVRNDILSQTHQERQIPVMTAPSPANTMEGSPSVAPTQIPIQQVRERRHNNTSPQPQIPSNARFGEVFPRLLSRYLSTELSRSERQPNNVRENMLSMLYTIPVAFRTNINNNGSGTGEAATGAPTTEQINRATLNTIFSNILSPVNATCPISRDEFNDDSPITMIRGCNHIFNRESLSLWFIRHATCPMCRNDIRDYRPSSLVSEDEQRENQEERTRDRMSRTEVTGAPSNISIDRIDDNQITFSYDIPIQYNDDQVYRNILNTITGMAQQTSQASRNNNDADPVYDDIMDVE